MVASSDQDSPWNSTVFPQYLQSQELSEDLEFCDDLLAKSVARTGPRRNGEDELELEFRSGVDNNVYGEKDVRHLWDPQTGKDLIWESLREEAADDAAREPLLSGFLHGSVLSHSNFEQALAAVLAQRLASRTLLATALIEIFIDVLMSEKYVRLAARADLLATKVRDPSCLSYSQALLYYKGFHAIQAHRISHALWARGQTILALALQSRMSEVFAVDIHPGARIGKGVLLDHGTGCVIGATAVIGDRVSIMQGVTLGGTGKVDGDRHPKVGEGVLIGASATILGNIKVRKGAMIAAGSLVLKDVPAFTMWAGSPAKEIGKIDRGSSLPAIEMKQEVTRSFCEMWEQSVRNSMGDRGEVEKTEPPIAAQTAVEAAAPAEAAERGVGRGVARCDGGVSWESTVREKLGVKRKTDLLLHRRWTSDQRRSKDASKQADGAA